MKTATNRMFAKQDTPPDRTFLSHGGLLFSPVWGAFTYPRLPKKSQKKICTWLDFWYIGGMNRRVTINFCLLFIAPWRCRSLLPCDSSRLGANFMGGHYV